MSAQTSPAAKAGSLPLALIAAVAKNGAIGRDNGLPWRISGDLQFFKRTTLGKPLIMGRKTYESIGRPLPGRDNIVISRDGGWRAEGVTVAASLVQALARAQESGVALGASEIMIIGGAEVYAQTIHLAQRLYLTEVDVSVDGDAFFPKLCNHWQESCRKYCLAAAGDEYNYSLVQYTRSK